jgi:Ca-activated chloride channel homolog
MSLGYPVFLAFMIPVAVLTIYFYTRARRDKRLKGEFASPAMLSALGMGGDGRRRLAIFALLITSAALAAVAIARPLGPPVHDERKDISMDVIVALDVSDSMGVSDMEGSRLAFAKEFIKRLASDSPNNRYGLVLFSGDAVVTCPMTADTDAFLTFLDDADFTKANLPGTAIGEAILSSAQRFKPGEIPRAVVVVTDGENTYGADAVKAAESAKGKGFKVLTVGVGTQKGGRVPSGVDFFGNNTWKQDKTGRTVVSRLDEASLSAVAQAGGGRYLRADDAATIPALEKELTAKTTKKVKDPFAGAQEFGPQFALLAAVLLGIAIIL